METTATVETTPTPAAVVAAATPKKRTTPKPKDAKKAVPAKAAPKAKAKKAATTPADEDTRTITPLIKATSNPCKPASFCYAQVHAVLTSKTLAEARRKLAADPRNPTKTRSLELGWLVKKKFIKVSA
jgi:hypothetical protein